MALGQSRRPLGAALTRYRGGSSCQWGQARGHQLGCEAKRGFGSAQPEPVVVIPLRSPSRCDARTADPSAAAAFEFGYQFDADLECKKSTIHLTLLKASEAIQSSAYGADASTSQQDEGSPMGSGKSTTPQTLSDRK